jgi:hypothetical protein
MKKETKLRAKDECSINDDLIKDDLIAGYVVSQNLMSLMRETGAGMTDRVEKLWMINQVFFKHL